MLAVHWQARRPDIVAAHCLLATNSSVPISGCNAADDIARHICIAKSRSGLPMRSSRAFRVGTRAALFACHLGQDSFRADAVRVIQGVFASCLGLFEGMTDGERVAILLDLQGRKVRVSIGIDTFAGLT